MKILIFVLSVLLLTGCTHRYKYYDFDPVSIEVDGGQIHLSIRGHFQKAGKFPQTTMRANPYRFLVAFETDDEPGQSVEFQITELSSASQPSRAVTWASSTITDRHGSRPNISRAAFSVPNLNLSHEIISVKGKIKYKGESHEFSATLHPKYWSEWRSNLFDALMSA